jgi:hypothetical protein
VYAKLRKDGIGGTYLASLRSFLCDVPQIVTYDGEISIAPNINKGIPQGIVLVPLLFIV